jgi:hypothetical protein
MNNENQFIALPDNIIENIVLGLDESSVVALAYVNKQLYLLIRTWLANNRKVSNQFYHTAMFEQLASIEREIQQTLARNYIAINSESETAIQTRLPMDRQHIVNEISQTMQMLQSQFMSLTNKYHNAAELQEVYHLQRDIYRNYIEGYTEFSKKQLLLHYSVMGLALILVFSIFIPLVGLAFRENAREYAGLAASGQILLLAIACLWLFDLHLFYNCPDGEYHFHRSKTKYLARNHIPIINMIKMRHNEIHQTLHHPHPIIFEYVEVAFKVISKLYNANVNPETRTAVLANQLKLMLDNVTRFLKDCNTSIHPTNKKLHYLLLRLNRLVIIIDNNLSRLKP